eukprot:IDg3177t1
MSPESCPISSPTCIERPPPCRKSAFQVWARAAATFYASYFWEDSEICAILSGNEHGTGFRLGLRYLLDTLAEGTGALRFLSLCADVDALGMFEGVAGSNRLLECVHIGFSKAYQRRMSIRFLMDVFVDIINAFSQCENLREIVVRFDEEIWTPYTLRVGFVKYCISKGAVRQQFAALRHFVLFTRFIRLTLDGPPQSRAHAAMISFLEEEDSSD